MKRIYVYIFLSIGAITANAENLVRDTAPAVLWP